MLPFLLREESILIPLEAPNREAALAEIIAKMSFSEIAPKKKAGILELILQRELFGTTAVGDSIALPHCFTADLEQPFCILAVSRKGIPFPSLDGQLVHLIFLSIFPESFRGTMQKQILLKEAENIFRDRFLRERLKIAETPEEACEIFLREAEHLTAFHQERLKTSA